MEIPPKDIDAQLSKIEENGEEEKRSETPIAKSSRIHGKIETGAVVKNRKDWKALKEKVFATSGQKKTNVRRETKCSFRHESNDHVQKPTPKAATPSEPSLSRGWSAPKKRSIRGKSNHCAILRQPCRYYLKGTCTRSPCDFTKQKRDVKPVISCCSRIIRLTNEGLVKRQRWLP